MTKKKRKKGTTLTMCNTSAKCKMEKRFGSTKWANLEAVHNKKKAKWHRKRIRRGTENGPWDRRSIPKGEE